MVEEVASHEAMVALGVALGQTYILIHVEGDDVAEANATLLIGFHQSGVHALGRAACGQTEHERTLGCGLKLVDTLHYMVGCPL